MSKLSYSCTINRSYSRLIEINKNEYNTDRILDVSCFRNYGGELATPHISIPTAIKVIEPRVIALTAALAEKLCGRLLQVVTTVYDQIIFLSVSDVDASDIEKIGALMWQYRGPTYSTAHIFFAGEYLLSVSIRTCWAQE